MLYFLMALITVVSNYLEALPPQLFFMRAKNMFFTILFSEPRTALITESVLETIKINIL